MCTQVVSERALASESAGVLGIGIKLDTILFENRLLGWQGTGLLVFASQLTRFNFAGFNIRLIECIDADDGSRYRRGDLPAEKFLAQVVGIRKRNPNYRVAGLFDGCELGI